MEGVQFGIEAAGVGEAWYGSSSMVWYEYLINKILNKKVKGIYKNQVSWD